MSGSVIWIVVFFAVFYIGIFIWMRNRKQKLKAAFENLDIEQELIRADQIKSEKMVKDFAFLNKHLVGKPIDAFTIAMNEHTTKDAVKDAAKDALKSMATLGTVKYTTVQTPKYLVLSGDELHLLDTDTDGEVSKHLVFESHRLNNSTIVEVASTGLQNTQTKSMGMEKMMKSYRLELNTDNGYIPFTVYNIMMSNLASAGSGFTITPDAVIKNYVVGVDFLKKLAQKYPNLKVAY